jgi:hypothetical protein
MGRPPRRTGLTGARPQVGPNLTDVSRRAGVATNTPDNPAHAIVNRREIDTKPAMPETGVSRREAGDITTCPHSR